MELSFNSPLTKENLCQFWLKKWFLRELLNVLNIFELLYTREYLLPFYLPFFLQLSGKYKLFKFSF